MFGGEHSELTTAIGVPAGVNRTFLLLPQMGEHFKQVGTVALGIASAGRTG